MKRERRKPIIPPWKPDGRYTRCIDGGTCHRLTDPGQPLSHPRPERLNCRDCNVPLVLVDGRYRLAAKS